MIFIAYFDEKNIVKIAQKKSCSARSVTAGARGVIDNQKKKKPLYYKIANPKMLTIVGCIGKKLILVLHTKISNEVK